MRGGCCPPKHPRRQNQCRWATLLFLPNLTMPIRSALVSEEIHWQKCSCITKANNLRLWEIKPCQEVQLAISREQMPLLSCLWKYSSIITFFPWIYIHICLWVPLCLGNLFWRFQFFCMGPVLYNKTVRDCCVWNICPVWEAGNTLQHSNCVYGCLQLSMDRGYMCPCNEWGCRKKAWPGHFSLRRRSFESSQIFIEKTALKWMPATSFQ